MLSLGKRGLELLPGAKEVSEMSEPLISPHAIEARFGGIPFQSIVMVRGAGEQAATSVLRSDPARPLSRVTGSPLAPAGLNGE